jgi:hypothetical protein
LKQQQYDNKCKEIEAQSTKPEIFKMKKFKNVKSKVSDDFYRISPDSSPKIINKDLIIDDNDEIINENSDDKINVLLNMKEN